MTSGVGNALLHASDTIPSEYHEMENILARPTAQGSTRGDVHKARPKVTGLNPRAIHGAGERRGARLGVQWPGERTWRQESWFEPRYSRQAYTSGHIIVILWNSRLISVVSQRVASLRHSSGQSLHLLH